MLTFAPWMVWSGGAGTSPAPREILSPQLMGAAGSASLTASCTTRGEQLEAVAILQNKLWAMKLEMDASAGEKRGQKSRLCIRGWNRSYVQKGSGEKD